MHILPKHLIDLKLFVLYVRPKKLLRKGTLDNLFVPFSAKSRIKDPIKNMANNMHVYSITLGTLRFFSEPGQNLISVA